MTVMSTTPLSDEEAATDLDEGLLALVCNDSELLAAEFDAIVAAEWDEPPGERPGRGAAGRPRSRGAARRAPEPNRRPVLTRPRHPGIGGWSRQRSPPAGSMYVFGSCLTGYGAHGNSSIGRQVMIHA